jgi:hypothetical protein
MITPVHFGFIARVGDDHVMSVTCRRRLGHDRLKSLHDACDHQIDDHRVAANLADDDGARERLSGSCGSTRRRGERQRHLTVDLPVVLLAHRARLHGPLALEVLDDFLDGRLIEGHVIQRTRRGLLWIGGRLSPGPGRLRPGIRRARILASQRFWPSARCPLATQEIVEGRFVRRRTRSSQRGESLRRRSMQAARRPTIGRRTRKGRVRDSK